MIRHSLGFERPGKSDSLLLVTPTGNLALISGAPSARQWVMLTLVANPLSTVFWPLWGVGLDRYVSMPIPTARAAIAANTRTQVLRDDRFKTADVTAGPPDVTMDSRLSLRAVITTVDGTTNDIRFEV